MDITRFIENPLEKPLDRLVTDGGFCSIFRKIACIGDSLSSGEFESLDKDGNPGWHDMFEYSWGQFIARAAGSTVYNFSRGGMTAKEYWNSFAQENGFWDTDKLAQAYIMALGVNDIHNCRWSVGTLDDINLEDYTKNAPTFAGYYAAIIQRYRSMQPKAPFFLMTMLKTGNKEHNALTDAHTEFLYKLADTFEYTYVLDLAKYGPVYDADFRERFYLGGHLSATGYQLTAIMVMSYIDYIIRTNYNDFRQVGFIGTGKSHVKYKW